jgi:hypothetical protein
VEHKEEAMKRNDVVVDGVKLTREQVARAMKELDAPSYIPMPGEVWDFGSYPVVVINQEDVWLRPEKRASGDSLPEGSLRFLSHSGELFFTEARDHLTRIGSLSEIVRFYREQKGL